MPTRPNVVFVLVDQMRAAALGCMGNDQVRTPTMDALAEDGLRCTSTYASNPVCSPARASILTGRYPHTNRHITNDLHLPTSETTLADAFGEAGYDTGYIGKLHLDGEGLPGYVPPGPRRQGFEYWAGFNKGHRHLHGHPEFDDDGAFRGRAGDYQPAYQTDLAIDFVEQDRADPFFCFLSWGPPHPPFAAPDEYSERYDPDALDLRPNVPDELAAEVRPILAEYYAMITSLDDQLERLLDTLAAEGIADETIVVFTSDHGEMLGSHGLWGKGVPYEESIHVPLLMRYPDCIHGGDELRAPVSHVDYFPTLAGRCDVSIPDPVQGRDLTPVIDGDADPPEAVYIEGELTSDESWRALRTDRFMLAIDEDLTTRHLYDMGGGDPYQESNLAGESRRQLEETLRERLLDAAYRYDDRQLMARDIDQRRPLRTELDRREHSVTE
jgi:arylsulfatase A-like enzyme